MWISLKKSVRMVDRSTTQQLKWDNLIDVSAVDCILVLRWLVYIINELHEGGSMANSKNLV
jgi:hypothetical protein